MMIPCFRCKSCKTDWIVDIYTESKEGIIQKFLSSICCPICGKKNLRICFIQKIEDKQTEIIQEPLKYYKEIDQNMV